MSDEKPLALPFGGEWTRQKLGILASYLNAYTTVMKNQPFQLMYIDAFAGTGWISQDTESPSPSLFEEPEEERSGKLLPGSAILGLKCKDREFDRCIFIERNPEYCRELENLRNQFRDRPIEIHKADANEFLLSLHVGSSKWRGVLFLDPFSTQVEWRTIKRIAELRILDTWILFPVSAIERMLPRSKKPEDVEPAKAKLNAIYGSAKWETLYSTESRQGLWGTRDALKREAGARALMGIYKDALRDLFGERFLWDSKPLKNTKNRILFEFMFCAGHPRGVRIAKKIATHLVKEEGEFSP